MPNNNSTSTPNQNNTVKPNEQKLYAPPSGHFPQELPGYCRFKNGVIRRDLQSLSDVELSAWGWDGPFYYPKGKQKIKNTNLLPEVIKELNTNPEYEYDKLSDSWVSKTYDYDPETQKIVWYSKERRYIFLPKNEDSSQYEVLYESSIVLPEIQQSNEVASNIPGPSNRPTLPEPKPILWEQFKLSILQSVRFNQYILGLLQTYPIIATTLPLAILNLEYGKYDSFLNIWNILKTVNPVSKELLEEFTSLCTTCNLPQNFINSLK